MQLLWIFEFARRVLELLHGGAHGGHPPV